MFKVAFCMVFHGTSQDLRFKTQKNKQAMQCYQARSGLESKAFNCVLTQPDTLYTLFLGGSPFLLVVAKKCRLLFLAGECVCCFFEGTPVQVWLKVETERKATILERRHSELIFVLGVLEALHLSPVAKELFLPLTFKRCV